VLFRIDSSDSGRPVAQLPALTDEIAARLARIAGVDAVTYSSIPVLGNNRDSTTLTIAGDGASQPRTVTPMMNLVAADFLGTLQLTLQAGRPFDSRDNAAAPRTALVNESLARELFGALNPLGRHVVRRGQSTEIIGVVRDARYADVREAAPPTIYFAFAQNPPNPQAGPGATQANFALRTRDDAGSLLRTVEQVMGAEYPDLPLVDVRTLDETVERQLAQPALFARLSAAFSTMVTLLVVIGLYGLVSHAVVCRTSEIGVRFALGAQRADILRLILRESLGLILLGAVLGVGGGLATGRYLESRLYDLSATDPATYGVVTVALVGIAVLAAWLPARRATKVDPVVALRAE
jgi:predicted permease